MNWISFKKYFEDKIKPMEYFHFDLAMGGIENNGFIYSGDTSITSGVSSLQITIPEKVSLIKVHVRAGVGYTDTIKLSVNETVKVTLMEGMTSTSAKHAISGSISILKVNSGDELTFTASGTTISAISVEKIK